MKNSAGFCKSLLSASDGGSFVCRVCFLILFLSVAFPQAARSITQGEAVQVRVAFVYNFLKYTKWPEEVFKKNPESLTLCVRASEAEQYYLKQMEGRSVDDRVVHVKTLSEEVPEDMSACQAVYIAEGDLRPAEYKKLATSPAVTITNSRDSGIIRMYSYDTKIRFNIHANQAEKAGIRFESNLMRVARDIIY